MTTELAPDLASLLDDARGILPDVVAIRRRIHRHPEIGTDLPMTQALIVEELERLGLEPVLGRALTSVTAVIEGGRPGPTILLRADMDALPLTEDTGLEFASEVDGAMHACGHDTHVAMLLGAARLLVGRRAELPGRVLLMFQPGEEGYGGANDMLDEGLLAAADRRRHGPDRRVRDPHRHALPDRRDPPAAGAQMASADVLRITVQGKGGHASAPHTAARPDHDRGGDRPGAPDDGHAADRRLRPGRHHDREDHGGDDQQHHSRDRGAAGYDPDGLGGDPRVGPGAGRALVEGIAAPTVRPPSRHRAGLSGDGQ